jgi:hypothetical protein
LYLEVPLPSPKTNAQAKAVATTGIAARAGATSMKPADKIKMALLAAKLAKEALELLTIESQGLARLQLGQIIVEVRALQEHIDGVQT